MRSAHEDCDQTFESEVVTDGGPGGSAEHHPLLSRAPGYRPERLPWLVSGFGVMLAVILVGRWVFLFLSEGSTLASTEIAAELVSTGTFIVVLVYGGYWLRQSTLSPARYARITTWFLVAGGLFLGLNVVIMVGLMPPADLVGALGWGSFALASGGGGGLAIGIIEARAIHRERAAERATTRAEMAEEQRRWYEYMNSLLRHEILNTANVISGNASLLLETHDGDEAETRRLETIRRRSENMERVIQDARVLVNASKGFTELERQNLAGTLAEEVAILRNTYDNVSVDATYPETLPVMADDMLPRIFSNLFENAVKHNSNSNPSVRVTAETTDDTVVVDIQDDGPGINEAKLPNLFEMASVNGADHGLGLYLVRTLVERYDGRVELTETGPAGSVFTVELPLASESADDEPSPPDGRSRGQQTPLSTT